MSVGAADILTGVVSFLLGTLFAPAIALYGGEIYDWANPVVSEWTPDFIRRDDDDLVVGGTMIRSRGSCQHLAPPMARLATGQNVPVISTSPTAGLSWNASDEPQRFGPWRVPGGAKVGVDFYLRYRCHAGWDTVVEAGTVVPGDTK
jgi:hypothetical protein